MEVSFIAGGNRRTRRKPPICRKSPTNVSHNVLSSVPRHQRDSNLSTVLDEVQAYKHANQHAELYQSFQSPTF